MPARPAHPVRPPISLRHLALAIAALLIALPTPHAQAQSRKKPPPPKPSPRAAASKRKPLIIKAPDRTLDSGRSPSAETLTLLPALNPRSGLRPLRAPLAAKPDTPLWADTVRGGLGFETSIRLGPYEAAGRRDPALDGRIRALFAAAAAAAADPFDEPAPDLLAPSRDLIGRGCSDPLVRATFAAALAGPDLAPAAIPALEEAAAAMRASTYGAYLKAEAVTTLAAALNAAGQTDRAEPLFEEAAKLYIAALTDPAEPRCPPAHALTRLYVRIQDHFPSEYSRTICEAIQAAGADPWLCSMLWARHFDRAAREAISTDGPLTAYAKQQFNDHISEARAFYEHAHDTNPASPAAAAEMILLARLGFSRPERDYKEWFDLAIAAQFDYPIAYRNMLTALSPRWGGDYQAMLGFGLSCAQSERYDTRVPLQFVSAALDVCRGMNDFSSPWRFPKVYDTAKQVLTRYIRSDEAAAPRLRALLAGIAWRAGNHEDAQMLLEIITPTGDLSALSLLRAEPHELRTDVDAHTGPAAGLYAQADAAAERGDFSAARALCEQALELCRSSPALHAAALGKLARARFDETLRAGQWAELPTDGPAALWQPVRGQWTPQDAGTIRAAPGPGPLLLLRPAVGGRFQVQGQIGFGASQSIQSAAAGLGIGYSADSPDPDSPGWHGVLVFPAAGRVGVSAGWPAHGTHPIPTASGPATFDAVVFDGTLSLTINGQLVFSGQLPPAPRAAAQAGQHLILGARTAGLPAGIDFANLRIRKLTQDPRR